MSANKQHFSLANNLSELGQLHGNIAHFGDQNGLGKKDVFQITMVSEEIFTNIISYGYKDTKERHINFSLSCENDELVIMVEDDALPFNLLEAETPDVETAIENRQIGGLGIHLTRKIMDEVAYERQDNKNIITLRKKINELPESKHRS